MNIPAQNLRFGMVQGRLIQSPPGKLQWFPQEFWEAEFLLARTLGVDYIELIAERDHNPKNPLWSDEGRARLQELAKTNGMSLHAFCNDYIVDHKLVGDAEVLEQNMSLIACGAKLGCEKLILPLFEASELTVANSAEYAVPLRKMADEAQKHKITICLETNLTGQELITLLELINHPNINVVYDTGNRVAFGHDLPGDIRLLGKKRIGHVHIKDKNAKNENVILGTGLVNFKEVFEALHDIGYEGPYTFETNRGKNPTRTAIHNINLVNFFHAEAQ